jgi:hypothetical protein
LRDDRAFMQEEGGRILLAFWNLETIGRQDILSFGVRTVCSGNCFRDLQHGRSTGAEPVSRLLMHKSGNYSPIKLAISMTAMF